MPRRARLIRAGEFYHVLARGNNRLELFCEGQDFQYALAVLQRYRLKWEVQVFHYCLMTTHLHFLLRGKESNEGISRMMHDFETVYAMFFQKKYGYTGHVFESRFRSYVIQESAYLLECGRYIELNPVRAGMVQAPEDYPWSSSGFYLLGHSNELLTVNPEFMGMAPDPEQRLKAFRHFLKQEPRLSAGLWMWRDSPGSVPGLSPR